MTEELLIRHFNAQRVDARDILKAQQIAADCLEHLKGFLKPGMTYVQIHEECRSRMIAKGAQGFWTHDDPALILYGGFSTYSAHEGPMALFEDLQTAENDFITVDVAPVVNRGWGDMARSYVMEKGRIIPWEESENEEIRRGMALEQHLHQCLIEYVNEETTFADLHAYIEKILKEHHYHNCDYHGNFGHTIERDPKDRITIIQGVDLKIAEYDKPITFEPHICHDGGNYGIKHEDMYFFHEGRLRKIL